MPPQEASFNIYLTPPGWMCTQERFLQSLRCTTLMSTCSALSRWYWRALQWVRKKNNHSHSYKTIMSYCKAELTLPIFQVHFSFAVWCRVCVSTSPQAAFNRFSWPLRSFTSSSSSTTCFCRSALWKHNFIEILKE